MGGEQRRDVGLSAQQTTISRGDSSRDTYGWVTMWRGIKAEKRVRRALDVGTCITRLLYAVIWRRMMSTSKIRFYPAQLVCRLCTRRSISQSVPSWCGNLQPLTTHQFSCQALNEHPRWHINNNTHTDGWPRVFLARWLLAELDIWSAPVLIIPKVDITAKLSSSLLFLEALSQEVETGLDAALTSDLSATQGTAYHNLVTAPWPSIKHRSVLTTNICKNWGIPIRNWESTENG